VAFTFDILEGLVAVALYLKAHFLATAKLFAVVKE
jgi:hypothetical protein